MRSIEESVTMERSTADHPHPPTSDPLPTDSHPLEEVEPRTEPPSPQSPVDAVDAVEVEVDQIMDSVEEADCSDKSPSIRNDCGNNPYQMDTE